MIAGATAPISFRGAVRGSAVSNAARKTIKPVRVAVKAEAAAAPVEKTSNPMKIVFVSCEVAPWSKTGGLGDVVGSLPEELAKRGHKVMSIAPRYDQYKGAWDTDVQAHVQGKEVRYFHEKKAGVDRVFVDHPSFLAKVWGKTGSKLYGKKSGYDYLDNQERFALFCEAALQANLCLPFGYGEDVVIVANDWHSALVPVFLKTVFQPKGLYESAKCAMVCHNIAFQGRFWPTPMGELGLPEDAAEAFKFIDGNPKIYSELTPPTEETMELSSEKFEKINWLQAGFIYSDKNLTVSPNYADEITSGADKGVEMDKVLREQGIEGIVNGMDPKEWNPKTDKFLDIPYDKDSVIMGKAAAKEALQAEVGLDIDPTAPLFGYIGRLEEQKGCDIMMAGIPKLLEQIPNAQVVILGTGKKKMETALEKLDKLSPNIAGVVKFSSPLAHFITAGADFLMVPSRFEPCGLIQLHAMQYGTVPIVASTGGLVDTVKEGVTGFHMGAMDPDTLLPEDVDAFVTTCASAADEYGTTKYLDMSSACIAQDLTWKEPAKKWEAVLEIMMGIASSETEGKKASVITPKQKVEASA